MSIARISGGVAVAVLSAGTLLTACGGGGPARPSSPSPTPSPAPTATPAATATASPSTSPTPSVTPTPTAAQATAQVSIYLIRDGKVIPVHRAVTVAAPAHDALAALIAGPTAVEAAAGLTSDVPAATSLNGVTIAGGVATVDFSAAFAAGAVDSASRRVAQVVDTLTRFATVQRVVLRLDGHAAASIGAVNTSVAVSRATVEPWTPAILVEAPTTGATAGSPLRIWGSANTFEGMFRIRLTTAAGTQLFDYPVHATSGSGTRGSFDVTVRFTAAGAATLTAYEVSMKDGSAINVVTIPLTLAP